MAHGLEPYTYGQLQAWLKKQGFRPLTQNGSHVTFVNDDGVTVEGGSIRSKEHCTTLVAGIVAAKFGRPVRWLREQLGYRSGSSGGRPNKALPEPPQQQNTRDLLLSTHRITRELYAKDRRYSQREHDEIRTCQATLARIKVEKMQKGAA